MSEGKDPRPEVVAPAVTPPLLVTPAPHLRDGQSVPEIMRWVAIALVPAVAVAVWFFGVEAARVLLLSLAFCLLAEWGCLRLLGTPGGLHDGSAVVTGLLLGLNLPPTAPWWLVAAGALIAIVVAKHLFGGLGANIFNPALTARVFLLVSWPTHMTTWLKPGQRGWVGADADLSAITEATPLGLLQEGRLAELGAQPVDLLLGNVGGSLGEVSALAILLGAAVLFARRILTWDVPVSFVGSFVVVVGVHDLLAPAGSALAPHLHLLSGGLLLGAFFMATDMVTCPITWRGRLIFGAGCGLLSAVIRLWGGYPEGVSFAILLMNAATPLIDHWIRPPSFGSRGLVKVKP